MDLVSQSLRAAAGDRYWIEADAFSAFEDPGFIQLYFGLLYQQVAQDPGITIHGQPLTDILAGFAQHLNQLQHFLSQVKPVLVQTDQIISALKNQRETGAAENYFFLGNSVMELLEITQGTLLQAVDINLLPADKIAKAKALFTHSASLLANMRTKSYSAGVVAFSLILTTLSVEEKLTNGVTEYGTFMAGVATATTPEEVTQAIEVVALPPGSYRVKRESYVNIALNAYVGFYGGNEHMPASKEEDCFSAGIFAPVGFSFSRGGLKHDDKNGGKSVSLFMSVIDLGTFASFRFNDDQTSVSSDIKLKDIVAPGLFLVVGFGKCPVSIGAGAQMGPSLRAIDATGVAQINEDYYVRAGAFIAVDIPILNLYNRKDK